VEDNQTQEKAHLPPGYFTLAKQALYPLSHSSSPFCSGYFGDGILQTVCLGWLPASILLISASQAARITGMSHLHMAHWRNGLLPFITVPELLLSVPEHSKTTILETNTVD
jgi:hypothetical protein